MPPSRVTLPKTPSDIGEMIWLPDWTGTRNRSNDSDSIRSGSHTDEGSTRKGAKAHLPTLVLIIWFHSHAAWTVFARSFMKKWGSEDSSAKPRTASSSVDCIARVVALRCCNKRSALVFESTSRNIAARATTSSAGQTQEGNLRGTLPTYVPDLIWDRCGAASSSESAEWRGRNIRL